MRSSLFENLLEGCFFKYVIGIWPWGRLCNLAIKRDQSCLNFKVILFTKGVQKVQVQIDNLKNEDKIVSKYDISKVLYKSKNFTWSYVCQIEPFSKNSKNIQL